MKCHRCSRNAKSIYGRVCRKRVTAAAQVLAQGFPASRRAARLLVEGALTPVRKGMWAVESERAPGLVYIVTRHSCTCPYAAYNPRAFCKHRIAATILMGHR